MFPTHPIFTVTDDGIYVAAVADLEIFGGGMASEGESVQSLSFPAASPGCDNWWFT